MDLSLTPEEQVFREHIRTWLAKHLPAELCHPVPTGPQDQQRWARILGQQGWLAAGWPESFGGPGWSAMERYWFEDECAQAGAPRIAPAGPLRVAPLIMAFGSPAQQQRYLPGIMSGSVWWCEGLSEPGAGSDLASLQCRAERRGDYYLVHGQKTWVAQAQHSDWIYCLVRTHSEGKPHSGLSCLLIDLKSAGVTVRPILLLDGQTELCEVWFDSVEVPTDQLIGEANKAWAYAQYLLTHERSHFTDACYAKRELARLKRLAQAEGLASDTRFRDQIAQVEVEIVALEMLVLRALSAEANGQSVLEMTALIKIRGSELHQRLTELLMLAAGPSESATAASHYFSSRQASLEGGSNELHRNAVAQAILGR